MAFRTYQLVLAATPKRVSDVYGGTAGVPDARTDIPYRQLAFQAEGADLYIGSDATVSTTNYGGKFVVTGQLEPAGRLGPFDSGPLRLSDFYAVGAGATLHVMGVPF